MLSQYYANGTVVDENAHETIRLLEIAAEKKVSDAITLFFSFARLAEILLLAGKNVILQAQ
jgi:hypothetical protein